MGAAGMPFYEQLMLLHLQNQHLQRQEVSRLLAGNYQACSDMHRLAALQQQLTEGLAENHRHMQPLQPGMTNAGFGAAGEQGCSGQRQKGGQDRHKGKGRHKAR